MNVKELFFAGPDFYFSDGRNYAIDFNPRLGHFFNLLDEINCGELFDRMWRDRPNQSFQHALWKVVDSHMDSVKSLDWVEKFKENFPLEAKSFKVGDPLPKNPTLQSKPRSIQLVVSGNKTSELYEKFEKIEQQIKDLQSSFVK